MRYACDLTHFDLREPGSTARVAEALRRQGMALLSGISDRSELLRAARDLISIRTHRDSDAEGVTTVEQRTALAATGGLAGFTDRELVPHTDGSAVGEPPRLLMLACVRRPRTGGKVMLVDGRHLYDEIAHNDPAMLDALRAPRSVHFGGGSGHLGSVFEETADGRINVRLRFDDLVRFSPATSPHLGKLRELVRKRAITLDLAPGEGYLLLNDRWLHGRTRFVGDRVMLRLIGDPLPDYDMAPGFVPGTARLLLPRP